MQLSLPLFSLAAAGIANAYPAMQMRANQIAAEAKRDLFEFPDNFGVPRDLKHIPFDAKQQLVDVHGDHEWQAPGPNDQRGPCPGLNAAANHNYLPRDGIATRETVINGLHEAFGLGREATIFLETTTSFFDGDPVTGKWSIGGASDDTALLGDLQTTLLGQESGICGLGHLKSESDASITRGDFTQPTGENNNCKSYPKFFKQLLDRAKETNPEDGRITPRVLAAHQDARKQHSIATNPNYFSPAFGGVAFTPAAHHFVFALMANKTADDHEGGVLLPSTLMQFFSYEEKNGQLVYTYGHERIPENFYKRNELDNWGLVDILAGVVQQCLAYPATCAIGGNTGTVNSFAGIEVGDISGGLYNSAALTDPEKLGCFLSQNIQAEVPSALSGLVQKNQLADLVTSTLLPALAQGLGACNDVKNFNGKPRTMASYASKYPGATNKGVPKSRSYSDKPGGTDSIDM